MKSGLLQGMAMNPVDAVNYSAGEADHIYIAIKKDYRDQALTLINDDKKCMIRTT